MSWHEPVRASRIVGVRRASLKAVARVYGAAEPSDSECDHASWDLGLRGAYHSLPGRGVALAAAPDSERVVLRAPAPQPPLGWALATGLAAFGVVLWTAPAALFWEARGHLPIPGRLGVPDAPASLVFTALARAWALLLAPVAAPDVALTLFALASFGALAFAAFLLIQRALRRVLGASVSSLLAVLLALGVVGALPSGAPAAWIGADVVLAAAALTAAAWCAIVWLDPRVARRERYLLLASYLALLAFAGPVPALLPVGALSMFAIRVLRVSRS